MLLYEYVQPALFLCQNFSLILQKELCFHLSLQYGAFRSTRTNIIQHVVVVINYVVTKFPMIVLVFVLESYC